jgi:hypothetical protein
MEFLRFLLASALVLALFSVDNWRLKKSNLPVRKKVHDSLYIDSTLLKSKNISRNDSLEKGKYPLLD